MAASAGIMLEFKQLLRPGSPWLVVVASMSFRGILAQDLTGRHDDHSRRDDRDMSDSRGDEGGGGGLSTGAIVGIALGATFAVVLVVVFYCMARRRRSSNFDLTVQLGDDDSSDGGMAGMFGSGMGGGLKDKDLVVSKHVKAELDPADEIEMGLVMEGKGGKGEDKVMKWLSTADVDVGLADVAVAGAKPLQPLAAAKGAVAPGGGVRRPDGKFFDEEDLVKPMDQRGVVYHKLPPSATASPAASTVEGAGSLRSTMTRRAVADMMGQAPGAQSAMEEAGGGLAPEEQGQGVAVSMGALAGATAARQGVVFTPISLSRRNTADNLPSGAPPPGLLATAATAAAAAGRPRRLSRLSRGEYGPAAAGYGAAAALAGLGMGMGESLARDSFSSLRVGMPPLPLGVMTGGDNESLWGTEALSARGGRSIGGASFTESVINDMNSMLLPQGSGPSAATLPYPVPPAPLPYPSAATAPPVPAMPSPAPASLGVSSPGGLPVSTVSVEAPLGMPPPPAFNMAYAAAGGPTFPLPPLPGSTAPAAAMPSGPLGTNAMASMAVAGGAAAGAASAAAVYYTRSGSGGGAAPVMPGTAFPALLPVAEEASSRDTSNTVTPAPTPGAATAATRYFLDRSSNDGSSLPPLPLPGMPSSSGGRVSGDGVAGSSGAGINSIVAKLATRMYPELPSLPELQPMDVAATATPALPPITDASQLVAAAAAATAAAASSTVSSVAAAVPEPIASDSPKAQPAEEQQEGSEAAVASAAAETALPDDPAVPRPPTGSTFMVYNAMFKAQGASLANTSLDTWLPGSSTAGVATARLSLSGQRLQQQQQPPQAQAQSPSPSPVEAGSASEVDTASPQTPLEGSGPSADVWLLAPAVLAAVAVAVAAEDVVVGGSASATASDAAEGSPVRGVVQADAGEGAPAAALGSACDLTNGPMFDHVEPEVYHTYLAGSSENTAEPSVATGAVAADVLAGSVAAADVAAGSVAAADVAAGSEDPAPAGDEAVQGCQGEAVDASDEADAATVATADATAMPADATAPSATVLAVEEAAAANVINDAAKLTSKADSPSRIQQQHSLWVDIPDPSSVLLVPAAQPMQHSASQNALLMDPGSGDSAHLDPGLTPVSLVSRVSEMSYESGATTHVSSLFSPTHIMPSEVLKRITEGGREGHDGSQGGSDVGSFSAVAAPAPSVLEPVGDAAAHAGSPSKPSQLPPLDEQLQPPSDDDPAAAAAPVPTPTPHASAFAAHQEEAEESGGSTDASPADPSVADTADASAEDSSQQQPEQPQAPNTRQPPPQLQVLLPQPNHQQQQHPQVPPSPAMSMADSDSGLEAIATARGLSRTNTSHSLLQLQQQHSQSQSLLTEGRSRTSSETAVAAARAVAEPVAAEKEGGESREGHHSGERGSSGGRPSSPGGNQAAPSTGRTPSQRLSVISPRSALWSPGGAGGDEVQRAYGEHRRSTISNMSDCFAPQLLMPEMVFKQLQHTAAGDGVAEGAGAEEEQEQGAAQAAMSGDNSVAAQAPTAAAEGDGNDGAADDAEAPQQQSSLGVDAGESAAAAAAAEVSSHPATGLNESALQQQQQLGPQPEEQQEKEATALEQSSQPPDASLADVPVAEAQQLPLPQLPATQGASAENPQHPAAPASAENPQHPAAPASAENPQHPAAPAPAKQHDINLTFDLPAPMAAPDASGSSPLGGGAEVVAPEAAGMAAAEEELAVAGAAVEVGEQAGSAEVEGAAPPPAAEGNDSQTEVRGEREVSLGDGIAEAPSTVTGAAAATLDPLPSAPLHVATQQPQQDISAAAAAATAGPVVQLLDPVTPEVPNGPSHMALDANSPTSNLISPAKVDEESARVVSRAEVEEDEEKARLKSELSGLLSHLLASKAHGEGNV